MLSFDIIGMDDVSFHFIAWKIFSFTLEAQKRIYRFYDDRFERVDPQGSQTGGEIVKSSFRYEDILEISLENSQDLTIT